jgi:hypothetical protein
MPRYNRRMNDPASPPTQSPESPVLLGASAGMSSGNGPGGQAARNWLPWIVAVIAILFVVGIAFLVGSRREARTTSGIDPYAAHLAIGNVQISQANNFAGDQLTYVDGTILNRGDKTVTSIAVRVLFANDDGEPPQTKRVPLTLIRTRQPYVDIEPVSAAPLKPGASQEFRLIFDDVSPLWNQQIPKVEVANVTLYR